MDRRAVHDPAAPAADRAGARQSAVSGRDGLRGRAGGGRKGRIICQPRVLGPGPRWRVHVPDGHRAGLEAAPAVRAGLAAGRVLPRGDHQRVSRRRLHHRSADRRHDLRRRRVLLAGADAGDQVLRRRARRPALSEHHSHPQHDARADVGKLHPPDGCRRRRHGRPDHADEDDADDHQRAAERHEGHARAAGGRGGGRAARSGHRHEVGRARLARDHRGDVADADVQPDCRRPDVRGSRTSSRRSSW